MDRVSEEKMLEFCQLQRRAFDKEAWRKLEHPDREELALTAYFLATLPWYGHEDELVEIAEELRPGIGESLAAVIADKQFDCGRFSAMLRKKVTS